MDNTITSTDLKGLPKDSRMYAEPNTVRATELPKETRFSVAFTKFLPVLAHFIEAERDLEDINHSFDPAYGNWLRDAVAARAVVSGYGSAFMSGFIEGVDRDQVTLFPDCLEDWIGEDHLDRVVDLFVDQLDLAELGFARAAHARTGRPGYHPSVLLKLFIYGYLNRIPSSRRLEREAGRNVEVMWLLGRLVPDHKTIADFR